MRVICFSLLAAILCPLFLRGEGFYFPLNEGTGEEASDSFSGITAKLKDVEWVDGKYGKAVSFSAPSSGMSFRVSPETSPVGTLSFWIKPTEESGTILAYSAGGVHFPNNRLSVEYDAGAERVTFVNRWRGEPFPYSWNGKSPESSVPKGKWTMVTLVQDGGGIKLYINGDEQPSSVGGTLPEAWTDAAAQSPDFFHQSWIVGAQLIKDGNGSALGATVDEVLFLPTPLTPEAVKDLFLNKYRIVPSAAAGERSRRSLAGTWQFNFVAPGKAADFPRRDAAWTEVEITDTPWLSPWKTYPVKWGGVNKDDVEYVWYKRAFTFPSQKYQNRRLFLHFDSVAFTCEVFVNDKKVAENNDGFLPFDVDITDLVKPDSQNELVLKVGPATQAYARGWPIGAMHKYTGGISGPCWLESRPLTYIANVFVNPSVRKKKLDVRLDFSRPMKGGSLSWEILDGEQTVKKGAIEAPEGTSTSFEIPWEDPILWSPENPHLYRIALYLKADGAEDRQVQTFGFREVWTRGQAFYLNGKKIRLNGRWAHTGDYYYTGSKSKPWGMKPDDLWREFKNIGVNSARLHCQPFPQAYLDAADRQGFLLIAESALAHRPNTEQALEHVQNLVRRDRNHPSVIMWSGSNEFEHWKVPRNPEATAFLVKVREVIKNSDSSRPVMESGYGQTDGKDEIISVHYPDSDTALWPNILFWPSDPSLASNKVVSGHLKPWDHKSILMIGEHLITLGTFLPLIGPEYFRLPPREAMDMGYREWGKWNSRALILYRVQDLMTAGDLQSIGGKKRIDTERDNVIAQKGYAPVAFDLYPWTSHWYEGEQASYEILLSNDRLDDFRGEYHAVLSEKGKERYSVRLPVVAKQGETASTTLTFPLKKKAEGKMDAVRLEVTLVDTVSGQTVSEAVSRDLLVFPKMLTVEKGRRSAYIYDAAKGSVDDLKTFMRAEAISDPQVLKTLNPETSLLIVPQVSQAVQKAIGPGLEQYVSAGGRALVLAQQEWDEGWLPFTMKLGEKSSNVLYAASSSHPVTAGLPERALSFWRPNHQVVPREVGNVAGCASRIVADYPLKGLVEVAYGKGRYVFAQMNLQSALRKEPMAEVLLARLSAYLDDTASTSAIATVMVSGEGSLYADAARKIGLDFSECSGKLPGDLDGTRQILWDASSVPLLEKDWKRLEVWVKQGGRLVLHGMNEEFLSALRGFGGLKLQVETVPDGRVTLNDNPLNWGIGAYLISFGTPVWPDSYPALDASGLAGVKAATSPMLWGSLPIGAGEIFFDQSRWEAETKEPDKAACFATSLSANLRMPFRSLPVVSGNAAWKPLDLKEQFNAGIETEYNASYPDKQNVDAERLLRGDWPKGLRQFNGIGFFLADPRTNAEGKSLIRINNRNTLPDGEIVESFPGGSSEVKIPANGIQANQIAFLHSCLFLWGNRFGAFGGGRSPKSWEYVIEFQSGRREVIPVNVGQQTGGIRDRISDQPDARLALDTVDGTGEHGAYYSLVWRNPDPADKITAIRIVGSGNPALMPVILSVSYQPYEQSFF